MSSLKSEQETGHMPGAERRADRRQATTHVDQDRRTSPDRRHMQYGIRFATSGSLITLEDWLYDNCAQPWKLVLLDMDSDLDRKEIQIMFTSEADKAKFVAKHSAKR